jgi:hypothetical protein
MITPIIAFVSFLFLLHLKISYFIFVPMGSVFSTECWLGLHTVVAKGRIFSFLFLVGHALYL